MNKDAAIATILLTAWVVSWVVSAFHSDPRLAAFAIFQYGITIFLSVIIGLYWDDK